MHGGASATREARDARPEMRPHNANAHRLELLSAARNIEQELADEADCMCRARSITPACRVLLHSL